MKPIESTNNILSTNISGGKDFTIKSSAKAFKILSSSIYENKIKAIIREVSCNAVDGHSMAGKRNVPFSVHLPTRLEPFFSVQDFGVGLSEDDVYDVFTRYFESTKTDSNDVIGAMGLGSKSPFSYVDQFTVISVFDGVESTYICYMGDSGAPHVSKVSEEPTGDHNGVTVKVEVSESDIYKFEYEAHEVYKWFVVPPVVNTLEVESNVPEDEDYFFVPGRGLIAWMGNIAYPVSTKYVNSWDDAERILQHTGAMVVKFDIGELDVSASRESLSLDPVTLRNLNNKVGSIIKKLHQDIQAKIDQCAHVSEVSGVHPCIDFLRDDFSYKGVPLNFYHINVEALSDLGIVRFSDSWGRKTPARTARMRGLDHTTTPTEYVFLVEDQKRYRAHVLKYLVSRHTHVYTHDDANAAQAAADYITECGGFAEVTSVSEQVAAGVKPERTSYSGNRSGSSGFIVYAMTAKDGEHSIQQDRTKMNRTELTAYIKELRADGMTVFVESVDFQTDTYGHYIDIRKVMDDNQALILVNHSVRQWAVEKHGVLPLTALKFKKEVLDEVKRYNTYRDYIGLSEHAFHVLDRQYFQAVFGELYTIDPEIVERFKFAKENAYGNRYDKILRVLRRCDEVDELYNGITEEPGIDFSEVSRKIMRGIKACFPLVEFTEIERAWLRDDHAYINDVKEYIKSKIDKELKSLAIVPDTETN